MRDSGFTKYIKKTTYQCNVHLPYKSILKNDFYGIYEYRHYNQSEKSSECPFCNVASATELISETATAFAIMDKYPVNEGHYLIIPKRHVSDYFELSNHDQSAFWLLVNRCKVILERQYNPPGLNVGININEVAGQSISTYISTLYPVTITM